MGVVSYACAIGGCHRIRIRANMKSLLSVVAVLAVLCAREVESLPTGAPAGACDNLTPLRNPAGHAEPPQLTTVPYMINLSPFNNSGTWEYTPGNTYTCKRYFLQLEQKKVGPGCMQIAWM